MYGWNGRNKDELQMGEQYRSVIVPETVFERLKEFAEMETTVEYLNRIESNHTLESFFECDSYGAYDAGIKDCMINLARSIVSGLISVTDLPYSHD